MQTTASVPVSEYLASSYEVDWDYIEGELQERNKGEWQHGLLQNLLGSVFRNHRKEWQVNTGTELRLQIKADLYRVTDVCVMRSSDQVHRIVRQAPLICIEVLSPEDRWQRLQERVKDYQQMGVEHVWILNPLTHDAWRALPDSSLQHVADALCITNTAIRIDLSEVWAELDEMQSPT